MHRANPVPGCIENEPGAKRRFRPTEAPRLAVQSPGSALRGPGGCPTVPLTPIALRKRQLCPAGLGPPPQSAAEIVPGKVSPATYSVSAVYSDTATPPPPTSTFMHVVARPSPFFQDRIWDIMKVVSRNTGSPSALTLRNHLSARNRTRTCTSIGHWNLNGRKASRFPRIYSGKMRQQTS